MVFLLSDWFFCLLSTNALQSLHEVKKPITLDRMLQKKSMIKDVFPCCNYQVSSLYVLTQVLSFEVFLIILFCLISIECCFMLLQFCKEYLFCKKYFQILVTPLLQIWVFIFCLTSLFVAFVRVLDPLQNVLLSVIYLQSVT